MVPNFQQRYVEVPTVALPPRLEQIRCALRAKGIDTFDKPYPAEKETARVNRGLLLPIGEGVDVIPTQGANTMAVPSTHHPYGYRYALDLAAPEVARLQAERAAQPMPVTAAHDGRVYGLQTLPTNGFGHLVLLDHGNGYASLYAHLDAPTQLVNGQEVLVGDFLGWMGKSGSDLWNQHLHFQVLDISETSAQAVLDYLRSFNPADPNAPESPVDWAGEPFSFRFGVSPEVHLQDMQHTEFGLLVESGHMYAR